MFYYLNSSQLQDLQIEHKDDVFIIIDHTAKGERGLIDTIALAVSSPYKNDNWDGLTEVLIDPFWLINKRVRLIHYELPDLCDQEMATYLSILKYLDEQWCHKPQSRRGNHCVDLTIYFNLNVKTIVEHY